MVSWLTHLSHLGYIMKKNPSRHSWIILVVGLLIGIGIATALPQLFQQKPLTAEEAAAVARGQQFMAQAERFDLLETEEPRLCRHGLYLVTHLQRRSDGQEPTFFRIRSGLYTEEEDLTLWKATKIVRRYSLWGSDYDGALQMWFDPSLRMKNPNSTRDCSKE